MKMTLVHTILLVGIVSPMASARRAGAVALNGIFSLSSFSSTLCTFFEQVYTGGYFYFPYLWKIEEPFSVSINQFSLDLLSLKWRRSEAVVLPPHARFKSFTG